MPAPITIIIPTLQEERCLREAFTALSSAGEPVQIIVADGGSRDGTLAVAREFGAETVQAEGGRASQMNAGARIARGDILLFLHADTRLPEGFADAVRSVLAREGTALGAFRLKIDAAGWGFRVIEAVANLRSRLLQTPYGDQALFVTREAFEAVGGFPQMPIMEDFALVSKLRKRGRVALAPCEAATSPRRWRRLGLLRTTLVNWGMVCGYFLGVSPQRLAAWYRSRQGK